VAGALSRHIQSIHDARPEPVDREANQARSSFSGKIIRLLEIRVCGIPCERHACQKLLRSEYPRRFITSEDDKKRKPNRPSSAVIAFAPAGLADLVFVAICEPHRGTRNQTNQHTQNNL
jgi:hypothetical protein